MSDLSRKPVLKFLFYGSMIVLPLCVLSFFIWPETRFFAVGTMAVYGGLTAWAGRGTQIGLSFLCLCLGSLVLGWGMK